jgi:NADPH:quinone reductase-like Zn-dependent oxidoreductase
MKALALESFDGPPAVIELPDPASGDDEVLVRVQASSVNAFDVGVAMGAAKAYMKYRFPAGVGNDLTGIVEAVGDGVAGFSVGDRVFGTMGSKGEIHDGSIAELATPKANAVVRAPDALSVADAGALGVAGTTAMSAVEAVDPSSGARVLVVGATGGVGTFAIQLAAIRGAHVIASVRPGDENLVTGLGAAETVDYTQDVAATLRERYPDGLDAVIDAVNRNPADFAALAELVREGGSAVSVVGGAGDAARIGNASVSNAGANPAHLAPLADLVVSGKLRVAISQTYPLVDAAKAIDDFAAKHTLGKLVITVP